MAACPLSGCSKSVTPQTAKCPSCHKNIPDCGCNKAVKPVEDCDSCRPISDDCDVCPPMAQCPAPSDPTCAICPKTSNENQFKQQVYAYPAAIYGNNQVVGERNNAVYFGNDSLPGFSGVPVAQGYTAPGCGCDDGSMTGAAAPIKRCTDGKRNSC